MVLEHGRIHRYSKDKTRQTTIQEAIETTRISSIEAFESWRDNVKTSQEQETSQATQTK